MPTSMDRLFEAHDKEGRKRFKKKWDGANLGWGVDEIDLAISSKVYGKPCIIFTTTKRGRGYDHDEEGY